MILIQLTQTLDDKRIPYALVGGYAVALHGAVRGTVDVDLVIQLDKKDFIAIEKALHSLGLESRLPLKAEQVFDFREEYIQNRNLIAWNFYNPNRPTDNVDIILTHDLRRMKIKRIKAGEHTIKVAAIDDLIQMKTEAGRPQDLADIEALKELKK